MSIKGDIDTMVCDACQLAVDANRFTDKELHEILWEQEVEFVMNIMQVQTTALRKAAAARARMTNGQVRN